MRTNIKWLIFGIFLASVVTVWAATTNLGRITLSEAPEITGSNGETWTNTTNDVWSSAATVNTTAQFTVDSAPTLKTLSLALGDSLSQTTKTWPAVLTLESDITILRAQLTTSDSVNTAVCAAVLFSGTIRDSVNVARAAYAGSNTTDYNLSAAAICSVKTVPGSSAAGGNYPLLTIQYTDKND